MYLVSFVGQDTSHSISFYISIFTQFPLFFERYKKASEISRNLRLLMKEGGYLLSRIALQYHRRKWA